MLIDSPRISDADRRVWDAHATRDRRYAALRGAHLDRLADTARAVIVDFAAAGPCHTGVSWGKDSVVVAHLVATSGVDIPLVYATSGVVPGRQANPDSPAVRDAFLAAYPHVVYVELPGGLRAIDRWVGTDRRITGIRAAESDHRALSRHVHGVATDRSARPIIDWSDVDLWAYLSLHDLPIHPAYACTYGGQIDRSRVRVHSFGGTDGARSGRLRWEDTYYPDTTSRLERRHFLWE